MLLAASRLHRLRPFLAVGVLGGYTTFSFAVDVVRLGETGSWPPAAGYVLASVTRRRGRAWCWAWPRLARSCTRGVHARRARGRRGPDVTALLVVAGALVGAPLRLLADRIAAAAAGTAASSAP